MWSGCLKSVGHYRWVCWVEKKSADVTIAALNPYVSIGAIQSSCVASSSFEAAGASHGTPTTMWQTLHGPGIVCIIKQI